MTQVNMQPVDGGRRLADIARAKLHQAIVLQVLALITVLLFVMFEVLGLRSGPLLSSNGWGSRWPLVVIAGMAVLATVVAVFYVFSRAFGVLGSIAEETLDYTDKRERVFRTAAGTIFVIFVLDLVGLFVFMLVSRGSSGFLTLFAVITAVAVVLTCPSTLGLSPCLGCEEGHSGTARKDSVWVFVWWLAWRRLSECRKLAAVAFGTYVLGLVCARCLIPAHDELRADWLRALLADERVELNSLTMGFFAFMGMVQLLYAKWARGTVHYYGESSDQNA